MSWPRVCALTMKENMAPRLSWQADAKSVCYVVRHRDSFRLASTGFLWRLEAGGMTFIASREYWFVVTGSAIGLGCRLASIVAAAFGVFVGTLRAEFG